MGLNSEERIPKTQVRDQSGKNGCHRYEKKTWEQLGCWSNWTWIELMRAWKKHPCQEGPWGLPHPGWKHEMMLRRGRLGKKPSCSLSGLHLSITLSSASNTLLSSACVWSIPPPLHRQGNSGTEHRQTLSEVIELVSGGAGLPKGCETVSFRFTASGSAQVPTCKMGGRKD